MTITNQLNTSGDATLKTRSYQLTWLGDLSLTLVEWVKRCGRPLEININIFKSE
jgi:hypothetical protein